MAALWEKLEKSLTTVSKPGRYTGGELNTVVKEWDKNDLHIALAFPDLYEIGLSHLGLRILYELINAQPRFLAERVYTPWPDFQELLKKEAIPLYSLENKRPLSEFDLIGFSLQYELSYTNILTMLNLAGIPLLKQERDNSFPLLIAGGPCAFNPEPLADFFDFFVIGEAEEIMIPILEKVAVWKQNSAPKEDLFRDIEGLEGIYIPSLFNVEYQNNLTIEKIKPLSLHQPVRAVFRSFGSSQYPKDWVVPFLEIVHDRVSYEIQRGCTRGCRFCQAGMIYRPVREKDPATVLESLKKLVNSTGYQELSLTSLSSADYTQIAKLLNESCSYFTPLQVNVTLPSLRVDSFSLDLAGQFQGNRKSSLTFAPEAGTDRLRNVINKGVTNSDLLEVAGIAFKAGWQKLKLYFMIGLPTETEADLDGIIDLANQVVALGKKINPRNHSLRVTVSISTFVPKAHTPFQWQRQITVAETIAKQTFFRERLRGRNLELNWHDARMSQLEGVLARGDRRLGPVIVSAWRRGAQFDGWSDQFNYQAWLEAFGDHDINPEYYTRERPLTEVLPWSHLNTGLTNTFLQQEKERAEAGLLTADCRGQECCGCGVCPELKVCKELAGV